MPKPAPATVDDISRLKDELTAAIGTAKGACASANEFATLKGKLSQVSDAVNSTAEQSKANSQSALSDAKEFAQTAVQSECMKLASEIAGLKSDLHNAVESLKSEVVAQQIAALREQFAAELEAAKKDLQEQSSRLKEELAEQFLGMEKKVSGDLQEARAETEAKGKEIEELWESLKQLGDDVAAQKALADKRKEEADMKEGDLNLKIGRLTEKVNDEFARELVSMPQMEERVTAFEDPVDNRLTTLESENARLTDAVAEVENVSTRRVDWIIQNASQKVRPPRTSKAHLHASYFSPKFCCSGVSGLQLELQLFRKGDLPVAGETEGDCAVFLWANKGLNLVYKLSVGGKTQQLEKVFNGRVPYGTQRFCFMKDQINRETDTLQVSVEILEIIKQVDMVVTNPEPEPAKDPAEGEEAEETPAEKLPLDCTVRYRKNVNNRILDQVRYQVDLMRSRMVRKVEWRVEQASLLRKCFPEGEPICSTPFSAAGIEGMQLIFYPSGYSGATAGYCSLYFFAPAGATLRCVLIAGGQRREAHHSFQDSGAFGRTNFCRLEGVIDEEDDTVLLGIEIEEAHQDMQASIAHPVVQPGDRRTVAQIEGSVPGAVNSAVKLQRQPGKSIKGLDDSKILPSLWVAKPMTERGAASEKPQSFEDLASHTASALGRGDATSRRPGSSPQLSGHVDADSMTLPKLDCTPKSKRGQDRRLGASRRSNGVRSTSAL